jgi:hypothetical protein
MHNFDVGPLTLADHPPMVYQTPQGVADVAKRRARLYLKIRYAKVLGWILAAI